MMVKHPQNPVYRFPTPEATSVSPLGVIDLREPTIENGSPRTVDPALLEMRRGIVASRRILEAAITDPIETEFTEPTASVDDPMIIPVLPRKLHKTATPSSNEPIIIPVPFKRIAAPDSYARSRYRSEVSPPTIRRRTAVKIGAIALSVGLLIGGFIGTRGASNDSQERAVTAVPTTLIAELPTATTPTTVHVPGLEQTSQAVPLSHETATALKSYEFHVMSKTLSEHPTWTSQDTVNVLNLAAHS